MRTVDLRDVVLGAGRTKVIVPLTGGDADEVLARAERLVRADLDIVEWRIDHLDGGSAADGSDLDAILGIARRLVPVLAGRPLLATFRTAAEGGERELSAPVYADLAVALAESGAVDAIDLELFREEAAVRRALAASHAAGVPVIMSSHDFDATPDRDELVARLRRMQEIGADVCKLAVMPRDPGDVLALLDATWTMRTRYADRPLITMAMGELGVTSRLAGGVFGSAATFAMVGQASAPGQIEVAELQRVLGLLGRGG